MRFRRRWHRSWMHWHRWRLSRLAHHATLHADAAVGHANSLTALLPETTPWRQAFTEPVAISAPTWTQPLEEELDTTHLRLIMDEADTPEADHAFWEQSAEEVIDRSLEGLDREWEPWHVDPHDDPYSA